MKNLSFRNLLSRNLNSSNTTRHLSKTNISSHLISRIHTSSLKLININLNTSSKLLEGTMGAIRSKNNSNHRTMLSQGRSKETSITSVKVIDHLHAYMRL